MRRSPALFLLCAIALPPSARAEDLESDAVYIPVPSPSGAGAATDRDALAVRNPLGAVRLAGWDRREIRIIARKRAGSAALLERLKVRVDVDGTGVRVTTGFYLADGAFNVLPLSDATVDLTIDAPRDLALSALTFRGDVEARGFRAGATLSSQGGQVRVADVAGAVDTRTVAGNQWLETIRGSLLASGVAGDLALTDVEGKRVDASVYRGRIALREVRADVVRVRAASGTIVFVGTPRGGGVIDLATGRGDVRLELRPAPFTLVARARAVRSQLALAARRRDGDLERAELDPIALDASSPAGARAAAATLRIAAAHGDVLLARAAVE